jgi:hypothetical protein
MRERLTKTLLWLRDVASYAWIPALIVSAMSAYYGYENFMLQTLGNHPELTFVNVALRDPYDQGILDLQMRNAGTRSAYRLNITVRTVDIISGDAITLVSIVGSNTISREGTPSAHPKINVKQFLGVLVLCTQYFDDANKEYNQISYYKFLNLKPQLTKEEGGGGVYESFDVLFEERQRLERLLICGS